MKRRMFAVALTVAMASGLTLMLGGQAWAHEEREVGPFHLAVGFGNEPAYAGQENSVQMFLNDRNDEAVTDLGETLQVEVAFGDQTMPPMTMEPSFEVGEFGTPGDYRAFFFPTRPGSYSFHLTGTIQGHQVDETFTSGADTFSDVQDAADVQFPAKDPSTGQLSDRIDREIPRLQSALDTQAAAARDDAHGARTLAVIAIVIGGLGLVVGAAGLVRSARRSTG